MSKKYMYRKPIVWEPGTFSTLVAGDMFTLYDETATNCTWSLRGPTPNSGLNLGDFPTIEAATAYAEEFQEQYARHMLGGL